MKQYNMVIVMASIYLSKNQLIKIIIEKRSVTNVIYNFALSHSSIRGRWIPGLVLF